MGQFWPAPPELVGTVTPGTGWTSTVRAVRNGSIIVVAGVLTAVTGSPTIFPAFTVPAGFRPGVWAQSFSRNETNGVTGWCRIDVDGKASLSTTVAAGNVVTISMAYLVP